MSYGASFVDLFRRVATYGDKIIKGAKPAELTVGSQPSSNSSSIARPRMRLGSRCRPRCLPKPTR